MSYASAGANPAHELAAKLLHDHNHERNQNENYNVQIVNCDRFEPGRGRLSEGANPTVDDVGDADSFGNNAIYLGAGSGFVTL